MTKCFAYDNIHHYFYVKYFLQLFMCNSLTSCVKLKKSPLIYVLEEMYIKHAANVM